MSLHCTERLNLKSATVFLVLSLDADQDMQDDQL